MASDEYPFAFLLGTLANFRLGLLPFFLFYFEMLFLVLAFPILDCHISSKCFPRGCHLPFLLC